MWDTILIIIQTTLFPVLLIFFVNFLYKSKWTNNRTTKEANINIQSPPLVEAGQSKLLTLDSELYQGVFLLLTEWLASHELSTNHQLYSKTLQALHRLIKDLSKPSQNLISTATSNSSNLTDKIEVNVTNELQNIKDTLFRFSLKLPIINNNGVDSNVSTFLTELDDILKQFQYTQTVSVSSSVTNTPTPTVSNNTVPNTDGKHSKQMEYDSTMKIITPRHLRTSYVNRYSKTRSPLPSISLSPSYTARTNPPTESLATDATEKTSIDSTNSINANTSNIPPASNSVVSLVSPRLPVPSLSEKTRDSTFAKDNHKDKDDKENNSKNKKTGTRRATINVAPGTLRNFREPRNSTNISISLETVSGSLSSGINEISSNPPEETSPTPTATTTPQTTPVHQKTEAQSSEQNTNTTTTSTASTAPQKVKKKATLTDSKRRPRPDTNTTTGTLNDPNSGNAFKPSNRLSRANSNTVSEIGTPRSALLTPTAKKSHVHNLHASLTSASSSSPRRARSQYYPMRDRSHSPTPTPQNPTMDEERTTTPPRTDDRLRAIEQLESSLDINIYSDTSVNIPVITNRSRSNSRNNNNNSETNTPTERSGKRMGRRTSRTPFTKLDFTSSNPTQTSDISTLLSPLPATPESNFEYTPEMASSTVEPPISASTSETTAEISPTNPVDNTLFVTEEQLASQRVEFSKLMELSKQIEQQREQYEKERKELEDQFKLLRHTHMYVSSMKKSFEEELKSYEEEMQTIQIERQELEDELQELSDEVETKRNILNKINSEEGENNLSEEDELTNEMEDEETGDDKFQDSHKKSNDESSQDNEDSEQKDTCDDIQYLEDAREAIHFGNYDAFLAAVSNIKDINQRIPDDDFYCTLLHCAAYFNSTEMVAELLRLGAQQIPNDDGSYPVDIALLQYQHNQNDTFVPTLDLLQQDFDDHNTEPEDQLPQDVTAANQSDTTHTNTNTNTTTTITTTNNVAPTNTNE